MWRDPAQPSRGADLPDDAGRRAAARRARCSNRALTEIVTWDAIKDGGLDGTGTDNLMHSIDVLRRRRTACIPTSKAGSCSRTISQVTPARPAPAIAMITPPAQVLDWAPPGIGPHSAAPARAPLLVVTEEISSDAVRPGLSVGPPAHRGHHRADAAGRGGRVGRARELGRRRRSVREFRRSPRTPRTIATVTHDLVIVTWYAGGLEAVDISDAAASEGLAERCAAIRCRRRQGGDPGPAGNPIETWRYPVVAND